MSEAETAGDVRVRGGSSFVEVHPINSGDPVTGDGARNGHPTSATDQAALT